MIKVCYVVCYKDPEYIRTLTLVAALRKIPGIELTVIKNKHLGILRYAEVPMRLLWARLTDRPEVFVVGFRAHEIFWVLYPATIGKPVIFDEFIDHHDWLVSEHQKSWSKLIIKALDSYMSLVMRLSKFVLTDTDAHSKLAVSNYKVPARKVVAIPVGADEQIFKPRPLTKHDGLEVFFYGNLLPLHGINFVLEAIRLLKQQGKLGNFHFTLAGGRGNPMMSKSVRQFIEANGLESVITHHDWIDYSELPDYIARADLCLGGPFGGTGQAQRVVTGKTYQFLAMAKATLIGEGKANPGFRDRQNCLLVKQASATEIAQALAWAKEHQSELGKIGQAGQQLYSKQFSIQVISRKLGELIKT